jgi:hypothetical protein
MLLVRGNRRIIVINIPWYLGTTKAGKTTSSDAEQSSAVDVESRR